jgi:hypothetical protein
MTSIWLADLARVLATIDLTAAERADVAHMLMGTRPPAPVPAPASEAAGRRIDVDGRPSPGNPARETSPATAAHEPAPSPPGRRPDAPAGARAPTGSALLAAIRRIAGTRRNRTRTGAGVSDQLTPAGRQMPATDGLHGRTLARPSGSSSQPMASAPLLSTRSSRAVIGHLLARRVEDGPLDTVAAVTMLARRSAPRRPQRKHATVRIGPAPADPSGSGPGGS